MAEKSNRLELYLTMKGLQVIQSGLQRLSGSFSRLAGMLGVGFSVASFVALAKQSVDNADAMGKLAQKTGIAIEKFSALAYAAKVSNVDRYELQVALKNLAEEMVKSGRGAAKLDEELLRLADRFQAMPDGPEKSALAIDKFGRSGLSMIPFLNQGAQRIRALTEEAKRLGVVIDTDTAAAANNFNDALERMKAGTQGVFTALTQQLLPEMDRLAMWLGDATIKAREQAGVIQALVGLYKSLAGGIALVAIGLKNADLLVPGPALAARLLESRDAKKQRDADWETFKARLAEIQQIGKPGPDILPDWIKAERATKPDTTTPASKTALENEIAQKRAKIQETQLELQQIAVRPGADAKKLADQILLYDTIKTQLGEIVGFDQKRRELQEMQLQLQQKTVSPGADAKKLADQVVLYNDIKVKLGEIVDLYSKMQSEGLAPVNESLAKIYTVKKEILSVEGDINQANAAYIQNLEKATAAIAEIGRKEVERRAGWVEYQKSLDDLTFMGRLTNNFEKLTKEWGNLATGMADVISGAMVTAVDTVSQHITSAILATETWGQALKNIGTSMIQYIIQAIIKMAAEWVLAHTIMKVVTWAFYTLVSALRAKDTVQTVTQEGVKAPLLGTNALFKAMGDLGPIVGLIVFLAALGVGLAAVFGAFEAGGRPGVGSVALVGERGPELFVPDVPGTILPANATSGILANVNTPGTGAGGREQKINVIVVDDRQSALDKIDTLEGRTKIISIVGSNRHKFV